MTRVGNFHYRGRPLSAREVDILAGAAAGETNADTARRLWIATETVKFHRSHILLKLGAKNTTHAVALALQQGMVLEL